MTPAVAHCTHRCIFCWRPTEWTLGNELKEWDSPEDIIQGSIEAQRTLISGFGGSPHTDEKKYEEAQEPNQVAISLAGEPTAYPLISDLVEGYNNRGFTTFLVTNGTFPERLENMTLPTNLYVSIDAPDKEIYKKVDKPAIPDGWERINKTLELFPSMDTRTVARVTLIKDINMKDVKAYARLIQKAQPDFIECKAYMCIGFSRRRLTLDNMPSFDEVMAFSKELANELSYEVKDSVPISRVVLLEK